MRKRAAAILAALLILTLAASVLAQETVILLGRNDDPPTLGVGGWLEVHLINNGPVDTILLRCDGETMLVDSGLRGGASRVIQYLQSIDVDRLDYAFATHPHNDHIGGFAGLFNGMPVGEMLWPPLFEDYKSHVQTEFFESIKRNGVPIRAVTSGTVMPLGGAELTFTQWLNPKASVNDRSMIMRAVYGGRSILLAADVENQGQAALLAEYGVQLRSDILKMPHHGITSYTRDVHKIISPRLGVSSNGLNVSNTLNAYRKNGVRYLITVQGTVVAMTDGELWFAWQIPNKKR